MATFVSVVLIVLMSEATHEVIQGHHFAPSEDNLLRQGTWNKSLDFL